MERRLGWLLDGFGVSLSLACGTETTRLPGGDNLVVAARMQGQLVNVAIAVDAGKARFVGAEDPRVVAMGTTGPRRRSWMVSTVTCCSAWPTGLKLRALDATDNQDFDFSDGAPFQRDGGEGRLWLRGPFQQRLDLQTLRSAAEATTVAHTRAWNLEELELAYVRDGRPWRQLHVHTWVAPQAAILVTAQSPLHARDRLFLGAREAAQRALIRDDLVSRLLRGVAPLLLDSDG